MCSDDTPPMAHLMHLLAGTALTYAILTRGSLLVAKGLALAAQALT